MTYDQWLEELNSLMLAQMLERAENYEDKYPLRKYHAQGTDPETTFDLIYAEWLAEEE